MLTSLWLCNNYSLQCQVPHNDYISLLSQCLILPGVSNCLCEVFPSLFFLPLLQLHLTKPLLLMPPTCFSGRYFFQTLLPSCSAFQSAAQLLYWNYWNCTDLAWLCFFLDTIYFSSRFLPSLPHSLFLTSSLPLFSPSVYPQIRWLDRVQNKFK